ncbi:MAG: GTPase [bacterium]|nr:GTPase [bacterium]
MKQIPLFIINGMLDSGKTSFISTIIHQDGFYKKGTTLLITLEEGEVEYDSLKLLDDFNTTVLSLDDTTVLPKEKLDNLIKMHRFDRVIIENNAMSENVLELPECLIVSQIITLIDCTTFETYYQNMRVKMADIIRPANLILFNRIDGYEDKLLSYKRSLMLLNNEADYVFQNTNGEVIDTLADELPYDLNSDIIKIGDKDYGVFFIDSYDQKDRYEDKKVNLDCVCYMQADGTVVVGRLAMTCCENDIQLLGFFTDIKESFKANEWINLTAIIKYENIEDEEEPVLKVIEYKKIEQIKDPVVTL